VLSRTLSCRPCFERTCPLKHLDCLTGLTPDQVADALSDAISGAESAAKTGSSRKTA
jgi:hypothetical protein